eukprot:566232-Hanusia_phi.AAC.3
MSTGSSYFSPLRILPPPRKRRQAACVGLGLCTERCPRSITIPLDGLGAWHRSIKNMRASKKTRRILMKKQNEHARKAGQEEREENEQETRSGRGGAGEEERERSGRGGAGEGERERRSGGGAGEEERGRRSGREEQGV